MNTLTRRTSFDVAAAPERVFPLLCPVREYDWIEEWTCKVLHSESGVAELDCVFRTLFDGEPMTWVVSRYEPPIRIEFTCFVPAARSRRISAKRARGIQLAYLQRRFDELLHLAQSLFRGEIEHRPDLRAIDTVLVDVGGHGGVVRGGQPR
jgi:hypothetical protein